MISDNYDNRDNDSEIIDMELYNKDTRNLLILERDLYDIMNTDNKKNDINTAFRYIKNNKLSELKKLLLKNKNIINMKYKNTYLIHEACRLGQTEIASLLLFMSSKCNIIDGNGKMAQHYAINSEETLLIDILAIFGNGMNVKDNEGNTPLHYATKKNSIKMIKTLMIYKANPHIKNNNNKKPIHFTNNNNIRNMLISYEKEY